MASERQHAHGDGAGDSRCDLCRRPDGEIGKLWAVVDPIRLRLAIAAGALLVISGVLSYTMPRIDSKLDALDEMAKDMAALKVQVQFLIARDGHVRLNSGATSAHLAQGDPKP